MSRLEIKSPGALASIQDAGRRGWRRIGVPWAGALAPHLLRIANTLVGNAAQAPAIECFDGGQQFVARDGAVRLAVAGNAQLEHLTADGRQPVAAWRSLTLAEGETLRVVHTGDGRLAVVAVLGLDGPPVLGSASTYGRAGLGGVDGRALQAGDGLPVADAPPTPELQLRSPPEADPGPIRVVLGPQADHFTAEAIDTFLATDFTITPEADRMGVRLSGPALTHRDAAAREIVSDATVPGAIQVPGNGQPIVLLVDGQTAGGYPKIATVISADLARLADRKPGQTVRFAALGVVEAEALARAAEQAVGDALRRIAPVGGEGMIDLDALYTRNLLSGIIDGREDD
ncbi:5-oxoprolinase subunit C family protein [Denitromonas iodatirespirans]|uniref:Biotin-dependent carboxyltransferase family protein n=1 Tax=Denitromonas iodatirespirans TaxID=2795389 RepID=A0A944HFR7_DENI1|nr:biotin-dependent carboxyltransferase family protein [Denitromonas iodatirespirans]MBT0963956.1 biotin-dependent carboxyltransferase family protein [Denitromonas iodatirespirans]